MSLPMPFFVPSVIILRFACTERHLCQVQVISAGVDLPILIELGALRFITDMGLHRGSSKWTDLLYID